MGRRADPEHRYEFCNKPNNNSSDKYYHVYKACAAAARYFETLPAGADRKEAVKAYRQRVRTRVPAADAASLERLQQRVAEFERELSEQKRQCQGPPAAPLLSTTIAGSGNTVTNVVVQQVFGKEDLTYIADELWKRVNTADTEADYITAVQRVVRLVHCNEAHPGNMTAYIPSKDADAGLYFDGVRKAWRLKHRAQLSEDVNKWTRNKMWSHVEDNEHMYTPDQIGVAEAAYDDDSVKPALSRATLDTLVDNKEIIERHHPELVHAASSPEFALPMING